MIYLLLFILILSSLGLFNLDVFVIKLVEFYVPGPFKF